MALHRLRILKLTGLFAAILMISVGTFYLYAIFDFVKTPFDPAAPDQVFSIRPGQSFSSIAGKLEAESIIANRTYFILYAKLKDAETKIQAGEYLLSASKTPGEILNVFLSGRVKLYKITIPEGLNMTEIAALAEAEGFCNRVDFLELCHDRALLTSVGVKAVSLEGYLFPDTYFFPKDAGCENLIRTMAKRFNAVFSKEWQDRAQDIGFTVHEIVTLASIIEKETGDASERPLIASVFHNRLKKGMRLESDPTVIYGIKDFDGNIKKKHLTEVTPYNTYKIKGLPMGPIASPGAMSIKAALYPAETQFLFFVSRKDTTHQFSKTIQEHNRAVRKYQLNRR